MEPVVEEKELEIEAVARKMFYGGCCLLPWLWLVNIIYFRKLYFSNDCPLGVKKYAKKMMMKVDQFKTTLEEFDATTIPQEVLDRLEPMIQDPNFTFEKMKKKSGGIDTRPILR